MNKNFLLLFYFIIFFNSYAYGELKESNKQKDEDLQRKIIYSNFPITKIKSSLFFTLGAVDNSNASESVHFTYENKIRLNTSFNETDNLLTIIESGNALASPLNLDLQSKKGESLNISTLLYEFKINEEINAIVGPKMFGYNGLAGKSTAYNERIAILDGK